MLSSRYITPLLLVSADSRRRLHYFEFALGSRWSAGSSISPAADTAVGQRPRSSRPGYFDRDFLLPGICFEIGRFIMREPCQRLLKILKCPDVPALHPADESKQPGPAVRVGTVKHGQPVLFGEPDGMERGHQRHQVGGLEHRHRTRFQGTQIKDGLMNTAFSARACQFGQRRPAGGHIKTTACTHPDEFVSPDNL